MGIMSVCQAAGGIGELMNRKAGELFMFWRSATARHRVGGIYGVTGRYSAEARYSTTVRHSTAARHKGLTLIEVLIMLGISSLVLMALTRLHVDLRQGGSLSFFQMEATAQLIRQAELFRIDPERSHSGQISQRLSGHTVYDLNWESQPAFYGLSTLWQRQSSLHWTAVDQQDETRKLTSLMASDRSRLPGQRACAAGFVFLNSCAQGPDVGPLSISYAFQENGAQWMGFPADSVGMETVSTDQLSAETFGSDASEAIVHVQESISGSLSLGDRSVRLYGESALSGTLRMGNGNNDLHLKQDVSGVIGSGDGLDRIRIDGALTGGLNTGAGDDEVYLASVSDNAVIDLGNGDNYMAIHQRFTGVVLAESGNDTLLFYQAVQSGGIRAGDGRNQLMLGMSGDPAAIHTPDFIDTGKGNDVIRILGTLTSVLGVRTGAGSDHLYLSGELSGGVVALEEGNDTLCLGGLLMTEVSGGDGDDTLSLLRYNLSEWQASEALQARVNDFEQILLQDALVLSPSGKVVPLTSGASEIAGRSGVCESPESGYDRTRFYYRYQLLFSLNHSPLSSDMSDTEDMTEVSVVSLVPDSLIFYQGRAIDERVVLPVNTMGQVEVILQTDTPINDYENQLIIRSQWYGSLLNALQLTVRLKG